LSSNLNPNGVETMGPLFDWCLRNGLENRAAEMLTQTKLDPDSLKLMQRRLEQHRINARREKNQTWQSEVDQTEVRPTVDSTLISQTVDGLPDGTEAFFNQQLHAKLIVGCTAAKCHGRDSETLPLRHLGKGIATPRGLTRHNLYQVLQYVDRNSPGQSKVLEMATTAHGGQSKPAMEPKSIGFLLLQQWVYNVSENPEKYLIEVIQGGQAPSPAEIAKQGNSTSDVISRVGFVESPNVPSAPPQTNGQPEVPIAEPTDPCDPSIFNRRHHPDRGS